MKKTLLIISIILLGILIYIYTVYKDFLTVKKSDFLGNTTGIINRLKNKEGNIPFSFAFISDTENSDASGWLIKRLLNENIDFVVLAGDSVNSPTQPEHKFFVNRISKYNPRIPIFIVPSNHDVCVEEKHSIPLEFTKADFQNIYGPINFSFIYNDCLFIFISNIGQEDIEARNYLENVLAGRGEDIKHTFVFCSTPLRGIINKVFQVPYWVSEFDRIIEKYKVDYVISGDYHRHVELTDNNGIQYITSGSGGSHYHGDNSFGRFRNGTKVIVYPDGVMKEIVICNKKVIITDNSIRRFIYNKVIPLVESGFWRGA